MPYPLDSRESEADATALDRKERHRRVDVRWQDFEIHLFAPHQVLSELVGVADLRRQHRGHEMSQVMGLEIGGDVSDVGVSHRV